MDILQSSEFCGKMGQNDAGHFEVQIGSRDRTFSNFTTYCITPFSIPGENFMPPSIFPHLEKTRKLKAI